MQAYLFNDYWEDIGTIRSFFEANLALTEHVSAKSTCTVTLIELQYNDCIEFVCNWDRT